MFITPPTWILAGLFFLFGVVMLMADAPAWRQSWAGLSTLCLGGFMISMVTDGLAVGRIWVRTSVIRRAHQPQLFWTMVVLYGGVGAAVLTCGAWLLFLEG